jgi:hypothetical protein
MMIYILVNGRTRAICGVYTTREQAVGVAEFCQIDSWHIVERELEAMPVQFA